jgi:short-subunit dehydrogenase
VELRGSQAVVTGASSGIGAAIARELAGRGATVTLVARGRDGLEAIAAEISAAGGRAHVEAADLGDVDAVEAFAGRVMERSGPPDLLVNNAGAGRWLAIDETPAGGAEEMMRVPYLAAFETTRAFLPSMIERGSGRIACMTSLAAFTHIPGSTGYSVARWAMRAFADQLRCDLRGTGIGVTLLVPAEVDSPYFENNPGTRERIPRVTALLGGATTPEIVARASADAIARDRDQVIAPRRAAAVMKMTPKPILDRLTAGTGWRRA